MGFIVFLKVTSTEIKVSAGRLQQRTCPLAIVALSKHMHSLAHGSFSDLQSWQQSLFQDLQLWPSFFSLL